jgi:hypothetical protein
MKKNYLGKREKIINKIFENSVNGVVNVNHVARRSCLSHKWVVNACEYLVARGFLRVNRISTNEIISYSIIKKFS